MENSSTLNWLIVIAAVIAAKGHQHAVVHWEKPVVMDKSEENTLKTMGAANDVQFEIDTAKLRLIKQSSSGGFILNVSLQSDHCYNCAPFVLKTIPEAVTNSTFLLNTNWPMNVILTSNSKNCSSKFHYHFGERGVYEVTFTNNNFSNNSCSASSIKVLNEPWNSYLPILWAFLAYAGLAVVYTVGTYLFKRYHYKKVEVTASATTLVPNDLAEPTASDSSQVVNKEPEAKPRERIKSIDVFRGLSIVIMIFVNYKGGYYWFFRHSSWNGLTVADLVFPWFMFIMGINITLSVDSLLKKATPMTKIVLKLVKRTIILFALGLFIINQNTSWENLRVPGVLQRFAIAYLFGFGIQLLFHKTPDELEERYTNDEGEHSWTYNFRDIFSYWPQWLIVLSLETLWLLLTFLLPVPGCPTGYLGPGGLADGGKYMNSTCVGGAAGYIDRWLLGEQHIYGHPTCKPVYYPTTSGKVPFDPEGVLGSINGCIIVFLGSQIGKIFLYYRTARQRVARWLGWCLVLGVISIVLCKASAEQGWIPVNKNLWTTTFITTLSCMAFFNMIVFYLLVDVWKVWSGSPLDFVGMNSIMLYVGHETVGVYVPFKWNLTAHATHGDWLLMNLIGVTLWVLIAFWAYRSKFFLKI